MNLLQLIMFLENISTSNSRLFIADQIAEVFKSAEPSETRSLTYLLCGKLGPDYDPSSINIASKQMLLTMQEIMPEKTFQETQKFYSELGDLPLAIEKGLAIDLPQDKTPDFFDPTLEEFFNFLSKLKEIKGQDSVTKKGVAIKEFITNLSPLSVKYVSKVILGQMRLGFLEMTVIDGLVKAFGSQEEKSVKSEKKLIEGAYNMCTDLGLIAEKLKSDGLAGVQEIKINVGIPVRPAAAEASESVEEIVDKLGSNFVAQPKLDGLRLQVHFSRENASVNLFSRNLLNCSEMFPELMAEFIKEFQSNNFVNNFIIEGEVICVDKATEAFLPFQETAKRKRKHDVDLFSQSHPIKFFAFDLLFLNDKSFISSTHEQRRAELLKILPPQTANSPCMIQAVDEQLFSGEEMALELQEYFDKQLELGLEGVIAKKIDSSYKAGKRDFSWIKLKRIENGGLYDSIDTVVLGYYKGLGRRAAFGIGGILVGVYLPQEGVFQSIAKVGSGFSDAQWVELKKELDSQRAQEKPSFYEVAAILEPLVWVNPALVFSVRADLVSKSKVHTAGGKTLGFGLALRFPRIVSARKDKSAFDTTPIETIFDMFLKKSTKNSNKQ